MKRNPFSFKIDTKTATLYNSKDKKSCERNSIFNSTSRTNIPKDNHSKNDIKTTRNALTHSRKTSI